MFRLGAVRALILDIDGTLLRGYSPMPGLASFFAFLRSRQMPWMVASNNATKSAVQYQERLAQLGVPIRVEQIVTAAAATADYLRRELDEGESLYMIGEHALAEQLSRAGFRLQSDASQPVAAVVVGGDAHLTYEKLKHAALLLQRGARLVGTNPDLLYPTQEGLVPEAGATLAALEAATGVEPTVVGKPARHLFDMAVSCLGSEPAYTTVLGDRLDTDILGGQRAGLRTILITGGVDDEQAVMQKGIRPDLVVSGLERLVQLWQEEIVSLNLGEPSDESA